MRYHLSAICMAILLAASNDVAFGQISETATAPPKRAHHALVYDAAHNRIILAGGSTPVDGGQSFEFYDDVWALNGAAWTLVGRSGSKRSGQKLAYDAMQRRIVSYGGFLDKSSPDVLELNSGTWRAMAPFADRPSAEGGFVYDSVRNRFVAFGGTNGRTHAWGDTWEYDGRAWKLITSDGPPARQAFAMVYDTRRDRIVIFGGMGADGTRYDDTWEFDGTSWTKIAVTGPPALLAPGAAYDSRRGELIMFGGQAAGEPSGDTWSYNGREWQRRSSSGPPGRSMGYLAYDPVRDRTVLFGGRTSYPDGDMNDTWEWNGSTWTLVR